MLLLVEPALELGQLAAATLGLETSLFPGRDLVRELFLALAQADLRVLELLGEAGGREIACLELGANLLEPAQDLRVGLAGRVQLGLGAAPA